MDIVSWHHDVHHFREENLQLDPHMLLSTFNLVRNLSGKYLKFLSRRRLEYANLGERLINQQFPHLWLPPKYSGK